MLARLQQAITLGALLLAGGWAWVCVHFGHALWGWVGAGLLLGGYALVLALEMLLQQHAHGSDPTPRAAPLVMLRAWWGEVVSAPRVFCWRQPFRSQRWPDLLPPDAHGRRGVVLVHGFVCNRGIWNPWLDRLTAQGTPFVAVNLEPVFGTIDDYAAIIDNAVQRVQGCTGLAPVIVAHSMGGLAVRRWWAQASDAHGVNRVHHVITIGTPHQGTWLARFAMTTNARQMRQLSPWLLEMALTEPPDRAQRFTCFYSQCDNIVFPPAAATLPGADNRHLAGVAHVHMAERPEPFAELQHWLQSPGDQYVDSPASTTPASTTSC
jgi:triacylglycerol esterase/lipase EstA (alpha/beta hydrolase family)